MSTANRESPLSRWSRRKLEAREQSGQPQPASADAAAEAAPLADIDGTPAAPPPPLTDADMPALESLSSESDFSPFMSAGVSDQLRNRALGKLFSAPSFNIRDGLDEYDEDYTYFEKLGDTVTADMKHRIEMDKEKLKRQLAEADEKALDDAAPDDAAAEADQPGAEATAETSPADADDVAADATTEPVELARLDTTGKPAKDD